MTARSRSTSQRRLDELSAACARATDDQQLFEDLSTRLREVVPFDGAAWFATDPTTVLGTSPVRIENVEAGHCESYWERECMVEDMILFRDVARSPLGIATLYDATDSQPARSARYREFLAPQGYGDELRAAFRIGESTWGVMDLYRDRAREAFSAEEVEMVRTIVPAVAGALRTFAGLGVTGAPGAGRPRHRAVPAQRDPALPRRPGGAAVPRGRGAGLGQPAVADDPDLRRGRACFRRARGPRPRARPPRGCARPRVAGCPCTPRACAVPTARPGRPR